MLSRRCTAQACRPHGPLTQAGLLLLRYTDRLLALARTRGCAAPFLYTLPPLPFPEPTIVTRKVLGLSGLTMSNVALGRIRLLQGQAAGVTD